MKRIALEGSMDGKVRDMCKIEADELEVETEESGGIYVPDSRNDLIFDMRRSDEADGDSRIIGSGRRVETFGFIASEGLFAILAVAECCDFRVMKDAAFLRT